MYGINTLQMVFGRDEAYQIIALWGTRDLQVANQIQPDQSVLNLHTVSRFLRRVSMSFDPFLPSADFIPHWKLFVGLPLIAPSLILSRTRLAEPFFATIPVTVRLFSPPMKFS
jgi:midasin (ATPase involved in ribosome maturation)